MRGCSPLAKPCETLACVRVFSHLARFHSKCTCVDSLSKCTWVDHETVVNVLLSKMHGRQTRAPSKIPCSRHRVWSSFQASRLVLIAEGTQISQHVIFKMSVLVYLDETADLSGPEPCGLIRLMSSTLGDRGCMLPAEAILGGRIMESTRRALRNAKMAMATVVVPKDSVLVLNHRLIAEFPDVGFAICTNGKLRCRDPDIAAKIDAIPSNLSHQVSEEDARRVGPASRAMFMQCAMHRNRDIPDTRPALVEGTTQVFLQ